jgi:hypothetical protein
MTHQRRLVSFAGAAGDFILEDALPSWSSRSQVRKGGSKRSWQPQACWWS